MSRFERQGLVCVLLEITRLSLRLLRSLGSPTKQGFTALVLNVKLTLHLMSPVVFLQPGLSTKACEKGKSHDTVQGHPRNALTYRDWASFHTHCKAYGFYVFPQGCFKQFGRGMCDERRGGGSRSVIM